MFEAHFVWVYFLLSEPASRSAHRLGAEVSLDRRLDAVFTPQVIEGDWVQSKINLKEGEDVDRNLVLAQNGIPGIRHGPVTYKKMSGIDATSIAISAIPFTKRWPYRCEEEYRFIREGSDNALFFDVKVDLRSIQKVTISQRMPAQVYSTNRELLRTAFKDPDKRISRSTIYQNDVWINRFKRVCGSAPPFKFPAETATS